MKRTDNKLLVTGNRRRISLFCAAVLLALFVFMGVYAPAGLLPVRHVYAGASETQFEQINVLEDLRNSKVNGKPFALGDYPRVEGGGAKFISLVEYCYSYKVNAKDNYGLYIYVYNPSEKPIDTGAMSNRVQMAAAYHADGTPVGYEKFNLIYCNKSEGEYSNRFYKFKVKDHISGDGKTIAERVNPTARRYDISGFELAYSGETSAKDFTVGGTYTFAGYAAGYGENANSITTLSCSVNDLETIRLSVGNTFFRTQNSSMGKDHRNQLDSVYFGIDRAIVEKYGKLQKIRAEWWEYKTTPIVVTSDRAMYDYVMDYVGVKIAEHDDNIKYSMAYNLTGAVDVQMDWAWNIPRMEGATTIGSKRVCTLLAYLFDTGGVSVNDYTLPGEALTEWIYSYNKSAINGYLPVKGGSISADLFANGVDAGRTRGRNEKNFDADDKINLLSYDSGNLAWQRFWEYWGQWGANTGGDFYDIAPIYEVKATDMSGSDAEISARLFINPDDVGDFKKIYLVNTSADKKTYLFRFAQTDYFCMPLRVGQKGGFLTSGKAYAAEQTVFLDFDIIDLTFNKEGVYHVIPVVSNPIDIIDDINPPIIPSDGCGSLWSWVGIVLFVVLLLLFWGPLSWLFDKVVAILAALFRAIGKFFGWLFGGKKKAANGEQEGKGKTK